MTARLELRGDLESIGDLHPDDTAMFPEADQGTPRAILRRPDGSCFMVIGLTRDECRALAGGFGSPFTLHFTEQA